MKSKTKIKLLSIFFPQRCPYCREVIKPCQIGCEDCIENLPDSIFTKIVTGEYRVWAAVPYQDSYKEAILALKFGKKGAYAYPLAKLMAQKLTKEVDLKSFDCITFVPLHKETFKERGFNQSELLANTISEILGLTCLPLLKKTRKNKPQHKLRSDKREKNVRGVFRCVDKKAVNGKKVLIIDDIVTTGYTLAECARVLSVSGASKIYAMTFAITLPKTT